MKTARQLVVLPAALALALALFGCGSAPAPEPAPEAEPADVIEEVELPADDKAEEADSAASEGKFSSGSSEAATQDVETMGDTQRIGTPEYGYVDVPADYVPFTDVDGGTDLQYSDASGTSIFALNVFDLESVPEDEREGFGLYEAAQSVAANISNGEPEDIQGATVELAGRTAYQVYAYYEDGTFLVAWIVDDPEGTIHYISVEGPGETVLDNADLVEATYAFDA